MGNTSRVHGSEQRSQQEAASKDLEQYVQYIQHKKQDYTRAQNKHITPQMLNQGPHFWLAVATDILEELRQHNRFGSNKLIATLSNALRSQDSSGFIQAFSNKYYIEYMAHLEITPLQLGSQPQPVDFSLIRNDDPHPHPHSNSSNDIELDEEVTFRQQLTLLQQHQQRRFLQSKLASVEKEVTQQNHLVMVIVNKFCDKLHQDFSSILQEAADHLHRNQIQSSQQLIENPSAQIAEDLLFILNYLSTLIHRLYDNIFPPQTPSQHLTQLAVRCLFRNPIVYDRITDILRIQHATEIHQFEEIATKSKNLNLADLEVDQELANLSFDHTQIKEQFNRIINSTCLYAKLEILEQIKNQICTLLNNELILKSFKNPQIQQSQESSQLANAIKLLPLDSFMKIIAYCLVKLGNSEFLISIKILDAILFDEINQTREDSSIMRICILMALEYLYQRHENQAINIEEIHTKVMNNLKKPSNSLFSLQE